MSNQTLGKLALVAAIMVVWAVVQSHWSNRSRVAPSGPAHLIQGLETSEIASIEVGHGDEATKIVRQEGRFVVTNKANYPADTKQLNDLITKCLDIKTTELYTDNPKNHEDLEVTEEKAKNVIKLFKADGSLLTGAIVGKSVEEGQGTYVRLADQDAVYLAESTPWFRSGPLEYVDQEIVSVERADVNEVTVTTPNGPYTLRSTAEGDGVEMDGLPAGKTLKDSDAKSVLGALNSLRFDDVNTPDALDDLNFDHLYVCLADDSTQYRLRLANKGEKTYAKLDAKFTDTTPVTMTKGQVESEEELKKKDEKLQAQEAAQRLTLRHRGWVYEIPDWKAKYLTMAQSDLLEDKEPAADEAEAATPAASTEAQDETTGSQPAAESAPAAADPNAGGG
ncbi:MAG: DUF4340 domain-containing protein, partial [Phycisphaerales bacterium]